MSKQKVNKNKAFFEERANELNQLYQCLSSLFSKDYCELSSLKSAAKTLEKQANGSVTLDEWGYKIENLILPVGDVRNTEPAGIIARLNMGCECKSKVTDYDKTCDPFTAYSFHLQVYGDYKGNTYSWGMHLEKDTSNQPTEWHPLYHLHCFDGRNEMKHALFDTLQNRGMLYLNVPRLAHYPLDIVLGIGFCLMNFHKKEMFTKLIKQDRVFPRLYQSSQQRILESYYNAITSTNGAGTGWVGKEELCPQIA